MLVPQAMAYATLAGLPPEVGLYASLASLLVYGLLGPSRSLSVGPVAIDSLLTAQGLAAIVVLGGGEAARLAALLALLVAGCYLLFWALRLGALAALLTGPVLAGFTHAAALVIAFSQVRHLARVPAPEGGAPWQMVAGTLTRLGQVHGPTLAVGTASVALLVLWKARAAAALVRLGLPAGPAAALARCAPLFTVLAGAGAVLALGLEARGVPVVGEVPGGLPVPAWPSASRAEALALLPTALVIALVGFLECLSIARTLATRRGEGVQPDAELFGLGLANGAAGLAGGYPVTGGLSRSMVNHLAGAVSGRASVVTAVLIALALTLLAPAFRPIPRAALAAVVVVAVLALIDVRGLVRLWRHDRRDGVTALGTFVAVLALGVETGIAVGVALALLLRALPRRRAEPHAPG
jgi:SulP family sulfate permease